MDRFTSSAGMDLGLGLGLDKLGQGNETEDEKRKRLRMGVQGGQVRTPSAMGGAANSLFGSSPFNWFGGGR